jgi:hypothetical protein
MLAGAWYANLAERTDTHGQRRLLVPSLTPANTSAEPASAGVHRQPGSQIVGAAEIQQGQPQGLQLLQLQRLDAGGGGGAEGAAAVIEQAEGGLHFTQSFPLLAAFKSALLKQLLGGARVAQLLGGNLHVHHHLLQGEVRMPLHQDRENTLREIRTALQDLAAAAPAG